MQHAIQGNEDHLWQSAVARWVSEAGILNEDVERTVLAGFSAVPRGGFADQASAAAVYEDIDLPLSLGTSLTRPSYLIRMMGLINLSRRMRVLELGVGSGYLCAVMAAAGAQVFGVERNTQLVQAARKHLDSLGFHGVVVRRGEGKKGWEEVGPFDAIVVSYPVTDEAELPLGQLANGGVIIAPCAAGTVDRLTLWKRSGDTTRRVVFEEVSWS
jgi:protein-L-isoaspartate(D-aspartate) O-methyltransferase